MNKAILRLLTLALGLLVSWIHASAQGTISVGTSGQFLPTPVAGHHIDEFSVTSSKPIKSLNAAIFINPMRQISPGGRLTVFPTLLSPSELTSDSHFIFDIAFATILSEAEDTAHIRAVVEFTSNFPTSFKLAQIVAADGHSDYIASISGMFTDGTRFSAGIAFVPEPSVNALSWLCLLSAGLFMGGSSRAAFRKPE